MTRRLEAGPLLVALGALLLLVSLFLNWFEGEITAWEAFEVWDLVLFVLALGAIAAGMGLTTQDDELVDRRLLPAAVVTMAVIVASQILDPPPAAAGQDPDTGAWLALGAAFILCAGALLTYGRVHFSLTVEEREPRAGASPRSTPAAPPTRRPTTCRWSSRRSARAAPAALFARDRPQDEQDAEPETAAVAEDAPAGNEPPEQKQD